MAAYIDDSTSAAAETPAPAPAGATAGTDASAGVAEPGSGACGPETLQDFVMNIINDPTAKAAYLLDPAAALGAAGLGDLTPADVDEVLPLVADALPTGLPGLDHLPELDDLTDKLPLDHLPELDDLTDKLPLDHLPELDDLKDKLPLDHLPELGDLTDKLPLDLPGLDTLPVDLSAIDLPQVPALDTPLGDITTTLDPAAGAAGVDVGTGGLLDTAVSGFLSNEDNDYAPTLSVHNGSVLGDVAAGAKLSAEEFGGSVAVGTEAVDASAGLVGHVGGDLGGWAGVDTPVGEVAAGALLSHEDGVALAANSPLGDITISNTEFSIEPADTADLLDVDHLGNTGDAITGTVAHYVSAGAGAVAGGTDTVGDTLGNYLTGSFGTVGDTLESTTDTVSDTVVHGGDMISDHVSTLPSVTDALPVDHLPELPQLPDLPDVSSDDLSGVTDLTDNLPVDLPDTGSITAPVTDLVSNSPVGDVVHDGPVGGLLEGVTGHLPQVGDVAGLDLGL